jgi:hypothetical protein
VTNDRRRNAVQGMVELYTVVMGVALSIAVYSVVGTGSGLGGISTSKVFLFGAFLATFFPFHQGALRHLWDAYLENTNGHIRAGALIPDFILLFAHALAFVVLALLVDMPGHFAWALVCLLGIDMAWGIFAYFGASSHGSHGAEGKWSLINAIFVVVGLFYLISNDLFLGSVANPQKVSTLIALGSGARTIVDYVWCREFYFPSD